MITACLLSTDPSITSPVLDSSHCLSLAAESVVTERLALNLSVQIGSTLSTNLQVHLSSSNPQRVPVPDSILIPADSLETVIR